MKRKFTQFLMLLTAVVTLGMFVSCKDTNEDLYNELRLQGITDKETLLKALEIQKNNLQAQLDAHKELLNALESDKADKTELEAAKTALEQALQQAVSDLNDAINKKADQTEVDALKDQIRTLTTQLGTLQAAHNELKEAFDKARTELDAVNAFLGDAAKGTTLAEILDRLAAVEKATKDNAAAIKVNADAIKANADAIAANADAINANLEAIKDNAAAIKVNADAIKANGEKIQANADAIKELQQKVITMDEKLSETYDIAVAAQKQAKTNEAKIKTIQNIMTKKFAQYDEQFADVNAEIQTLKDEAVKLYAYADEVLNKAKEYTDIQVELTKAYLKGYTDEQISALKKELEAIYEGLVEKDEDLQEQIDDLVEELDEKYGILDEKIDALGIRVGDLETAMDAVQQDITDLQEAVADLTKRVEVLEDKMDDLENALAKQVTGIIVQGTYNPTFGSFSLPTGMQTNILMAYYGEANNADIYFPTQRTGNYINAAQALTAKDIEMLGGETEALFEQGTTLTCEDGTTASAGSLYLTVNPNTVDHTGLTLSLENSQAVASKVKLAPLAETDKTLTFGWTRAGNGFYEAKAYVDFADLESVQKIDLNTEMVKAAAKEIYNNRTHADFSAVAANMLGAIKSFSMDALAVKCEWEDSLGEHAVYSNYNVAASAIKPLGFAAADEIEEKAVNGVNKLNDKMWALLDKVYGKVKDNPIWDKISEFQGSLTTTFPENVTLNKVQIDGMWYDPSNKEWDNFVNGTDFTTVSFKVTFTPEQAELLQEEGLLASGVDYMFVPVSQEEILNLLRAEGAMIEEIFNTLETVLGSLNTFLGSLEDMKNILPETQINNIVSKLQNIVLKGVSNIGTFMRPMMVAKTATSYVGLSQASSVPTIVKGDLTLVPTSWNAEIVVPICKKHVAVTNVFNGSASAQGGDAQCVAALNAANSGDMNKVICGNERSVSLTNLKAGYTYEIAYSALDFAGQIVTYKYYVLAQ